MTSLDDIMTMFTTTEDPMSVSMVTDDYSDEEDYPDWYCDQQTVREFRRSMEPPLYWIIVLLGGLGNLLVVWIYLHLKNRLKTMTDVYLLNLAVADLLFLITLPLWAAEAVGGWTYGLVLCRINSAVYKVNLFSSVLLLTCISLDRYVAIVQVTRAQNSQVERMRCSKVMCVCVWLLALLLATPELLWANQTEGTCRMVYPGHLGNRTKVLVLALQVCFGFCVPFCVMLACYSVIVAKLCRSGRFRKHKALRVILSVVALFVLTQLPYNATLVLEATQASNMTITDCGQVKTFKMAEQLLKSLAYFHACLNPVLYVFVGERFRRDLLGMLSGARSLAHTHTHSHSLRPRLSSINNSINKSLKKNNNNNGGKKRTGSNSTRNTVMSSDSDTSQALSL